MASLTAYKVLLSRETSPRYDFTFLTLFILILYLSWANLKNQWLMETSVDTGTQFRLFFQQMLLFYALFWLGQLERLEESTNWAPFPTLVSL